MSDTQPTFPAMNLWERLRFAWWIATTPGMTELRVAQAILSYHERYGGGENV